MTSDSGTSNTSISGQIQEDLKKLGKYEIVRKIGAGGMGTVYLAQDTLLNRSVALKVLPKDRAENSILVRRFQSEARASAMLTHDNIVAVYDADKADGYLYIALEFIEGIDLSEWLRKRERIPVKRSIDIIKQVAAALQHAHDKNLVHRDIKPANIMITKQGEVKLADMGLARSVDESLDTTITRDGTTVGTVDYMSPEQAANSKSTDIRSDIYSLGCTWYHMLTGSPPFAEGSLTNKLAAHAKTPPPDPRDINPDISESVVAIIHRMMSKKKEDRYQTPAELLEDIENSANLEANSAHFLAVLLEEDEEESTSLSDQHSDPQVLEDLSEDDAEFEVQEESQSQLLKKNKSQRQAETTSEIPGPKQKRTAKNKKNGTKKLPRKELPSADASGTTDPSSADLPQRDKPKQQQKPKPLKRVKSKEELTQSSQELSSRQASKKTKANAEATQQPSHQKKKDAQPVRNPQKVTETKSAKKTQSANQKKRSPGRSPIPPSTTDQMSGIDIDWMRIVIVIGIIGLTLCGIWWGIQEFGGSDEPAEINPYAEEKGNPDLNPDKPQTPATPELRLTEQEPATETIDAVLQSADQDKLVELSQPKWVISGWDQPVRLQREKLEVRRGPRNGNLFFSLEGAFAAITNSVGTIEISHFPLLPVHPTRIQLNNRLTVASTQAESILAFSPGENDSHWLQVSGTVLELSGLHFIVDNQNDHAVDLINLSGTDLILRNCTFTSLGKGPVRVIKVNGKSEHSNRVYIENCLFRGEKIQVTQISQAPVDFYCSNSFAISRDGDLVRIEGGSNKEQHSVQFSNCSLSSSANLISVSNTSSDSAGLLSLKLHRSLLFGQGDGAVPIRYQSNNLNSQDNSQLEILHTRFVNFERLGFIESSREQRVLSSTDKFEQYWRSTIPSDDVIQDDGLSERLNPLEEITAVSLEPALTTITRPGVGERSLIGVDAAQVASLESNAIRRQHVLRNVQRLEGTIHAEQAFQNEVRFDLNQGEQFATFVNSDQCPDGTTIVCYGAGLCPISPLDLKQRQLKFRFEQAVGKPLTIQNLKANSTQPLFSVSGGEIVIENGRVEFPRSRSQQDGTLFLHATGPAKIKIEHCDIQAHPAGTGENQLILLSEGDNVESTQYLMIDRSLLHSGGPTIRLNRTGIPVSVSNSILLSQQDLMVIRAPETQRFIRVQQSTLLAGQSLVHCLGGIVPVDLIAENSVFSTLLSHDRQATLLRGTSNSEIHQTVRWWELACAHSEDFAAPVLISGTKTVGSYLTAWQRFWGSHHISSPLIGRQAVVFTNRFEETTHPQAKDFSLTKTGDSATWGNRATPLGANVDQVGPDAQPANKQRPEVLTPNSRPGF